MKRKGKASRVRQKNRCRFPAALVCAGEILDKTILDLIKKQEEKA